MLNRIAVGRISWFLVILSFRMLPVIAEVHDSPLFQTTDKLDQDVIAAEEYTRAAVATDHETCSNLGRDILQKEGSAVDAAIAALFCLGTVQFQSTGIGGGGFLQYYERETKKMHVIDFRETLPAKNNEKVYDADPKKSKSGGLSVGVPAEVKGLRAAWDRFGKLQWSELIQPSIDIANRGFKASKHLVKYAKIRREEIKNPALRRLIVQKDGSTISTKTTIHRPNYARTLEKIRDNPDEFYYGELAETIVKDINDNGGSMAMDDLRDYEVKIREAITTELGDLTLHTVPLPSGGPVLKHILSICKAYNFNKDDLATREKAILTYHRIVEAFKISYAYRPYLCDPDFPSNEEEFEKIYSEMLDPEVAKLHYRKIDDKRTYETDHYSSVIQSREEDGTTHVSLIAENGDAVSVTSSINFKFGALFASGTTGIIYNNQIEDSFPANSPWRRWSNANSPRPSIRPLSSMAPNIIVDNEGDVVMISGGSGGLRITLSVAWVTMMKLWFKMDLGSAVLMSRPYHSLFPEYIRNEKLYPMKSEIVKGLKGKGHVVKSSDLNAVIQAIYVDKSNGRIYAKSDPRKQGQSAGY